MNELIGETAVCGLVAAALLPWLLMAGWRLKAGTRPPRPPEPPRDDEPAAGTATALRKAS